MRDGGRTLTVGLELELGTDPISGRLLVDGRGEPFVGWLALASALEAASEVEANVQETKETT